MKTFKILNLYRNHMGNKTIMVADLSELENISGNLIYSMTKFDQFIFPWDSFEAQNMLEIANNGDGKIDLDITDFHHRREIDDGEIINRYFHSSIYH